MVAAEGKGAFPGTDRGCGRKGKFNMIKETSQDPSLLESNVTDLEEARLPHSNRDPQHPQSKESLGQIACRFTCTPTIYYLLLTLVLVFFFYFFSSLSRKLVFLCYFASVLCMGGFVLFCFFHFVVLRMEPKALHVPDKCFSTELHPQPSLFNIEISSYNFLAKYFFGCIL